MRTNVNSYQPLAIAKDIGLGCSEGPVSDQYNENYIVDVLNIESHPRMSDRVRNTTISNPFSKTCDSIQTGMQSLNVLELVLFELLWVRSDSACQYVL